MNFKPYSFSKTVASAATAEKLTELPLKATQIVIQAKAGNTNNVFIGGDNVSATKGIALAAKEKITIGSDIMPRGGLILSEIWVDVTTNSEGVICFYLENKE